jgi:D-arginine dehydrogenase
MRPMRRHLVVTAPDPSIDARRPVFWSDRDGYYARPESGGMLLCACDQSEVHPDACVVDAAATELVAEKTARLFPALASAGLAHAWAGTRTFAPDGEFVIGPDPALAGLYWAAALGGHGMSCAPAVGRLAAAQLLDQAEGEPLAAGVSPRRFVAAAGSARR